MSLIKQLWLAIVTVLLVSFVGSLLVSISTSRSYIEQEVRIKNEDNATALALSMSQLDKDPVTLELLIAAQFDTGYYRQIVLRDPQGEVLIERSAPSYEGDVPRWFRQLVHFDVPEGSATIQDGWRQFGTLTLASQHSFAYAALWRSMLELAAWFALAGLLSLLLAWVLVRGIKKPLDRVVTQARDIGARRFTTSEEPKTLELRQLAQAMNTLSADVHHMLSQEGEKLDALRRHLQHDRITGALNREAFMGRLTAALTSDDARASGVMAMVRVAQLEKLNQQLGHNATDALLKTLTSRLESLGKQWHVPLVGRLNGSDFAVMAPAAESPELLAKELTTLLQTLAADTHPQTAETPSEHSERPRLLAAVMPYASDDERGTLLATLDDALAEAESSVHTSVVVRDREYHSLFHTHAEWRDALNKALAKGPQLAFFPVVDATGHIVHYECPARLELEQAWQSAGVFLPWVTRLGIEPALDMAVVKKALAELALTPTRTLGLNLSIASITSARFVNELRALLEATPLAQNLCFEVPAALDAQAMASLRSLSHSLRPLGCQLGIEHVGAEFTRLADLHDMGLAYLKVDSSLIRRLDASSEQQAIVRGMATLCHSLGIQVIAEGVTTEAELTAAFQAGADGATGPGVREPH